MKTEEDDRWDRTPGAIRVGKPKTSTVTVCLPCGRCGGRVKTASFYLTAKARDEYHCDKYMFHSGCSVRLCAACLEAALEAIQDD